MIYTLAGALPMASAVILLPFYIAYLPTEVYGALSVCLAFSYLVQVIVAFSFDSSLYIHYHELKSSPDKLSSFISASFIFMAAWALVVGVFLAATGQLFFSIFMSGSKISFYPNGIVSVGLGISQAIFKVHGNLLQTREKPQPFLWSNVVNFVIIAAATIVGLKLFPNTLVGPLGGRLLAGTVTCSWVFIRVIREFGIHVQSPWKQTSFSFNAYTFLYQMLQWGINYFDRFLILMFMPLSSVGIYDFASKCLVPVELLLNGLNAAIFPKIIKLITGQSKKGTSKEINRYFYGLVSVIMLAICLSIIFIPEVIDLFVKRSGYAQSLKYIPYLGAIYILKSIRLYFVVPYNVLKKMRLLTVLNFFTSALKFILMFMLIKEWHLYGIIFSALVVYLVEICLLWYYLKTHYQIQFNTFKLMIGPIILLVIITVGEPLIGGMYPLYAHLGYGVLCSILLWASYRNEIRALDLLKIIK